jgi:hypothetical protein
MLSVKSKLLPPISTLERASTTRAELVPPFPTLPEEISVEERKSEEIDPTGILFWN